MTTPVFYLEIPPFLFGQVVKQLSDAGLTRGARIVVEKPFGHDLESADALAADLHQYIDESQLYRIDHYLGKMGLDEILHLRFQNTMLEPIWSRNYVAAVEITLAESFGVEDRGHFYDPVGALRDVVVNHLMQVVAASAMEVPSRPDADTLKNSVAALFHSIEPASPGMRSGWGIPLMASTARTSARGPTGAAPPLLVPTYRVRTARPAVARRGAAA